MNPPNRYPRKVTLRPLRVPLLALLLLSLALPADVAARDPRAGATVRVVSTGGQEIRGELLRVGGDALLIMNGSGTGETVAFSDIRTVAIKRKGKDGKGALIGLGACLISGIVLGAVFARKDIWTPTEVTGIWGIYTVIPFTLGGAIIGGLGPDYKAYPLVVDPGERAARLNRLCEKARFRD